MGRFIDESRRRMRRAAVERSRASRGEPPRTTISAVLADQRQVRRTRARAALGAAGDMDRCAGRQNTVRRVRKPARVGAGVHGRAGAVRPAGTGEDRRRGSVASTISPARRASAVSKGMSACATPARARPRQGDRRSSPVPSARSSRRRASSRSASQRPNGRAARSAAFSPDNVKTPARGAGSRRGGARMGPRLALRARSSPRWAGRFFSRRV